LIITTRSFFKIGAGLLFGLVSHASAGVINGAYTYSYTNTVADATCVAPADGTRDFFSSTGGGNSINPIAPVAFSICDGATGLLDSGDFTIGSGADTATGAFSGTFAGVSTNPGLLPDGGPLAGGALFDGAFTIESATGIYAGTVGDYGAFVVNTGATDAASDQLSGTFTFTTTPEPVSMLMAGSGLLLIGLRKKLRKA
jgi:hypothetical protein